MKRPSRILTLLSVVAGCLSSIYAQEQQQVFCSTPEVMEHYNSIHAEAAEQEEALRQLATSHFKNRPTATTEDTDTYRIAVVFHVYGNVQGGHTIDNVLIHGAIDKLNEDFQGRNDDYHTVHDHFKPLRSFKNIRFFLARLDPDGQPTTGINYYPEASGFANSTGYNTQIQAHAWDNYRYVNVYVQHDIFGNGTTYNSGVAYLPSSQMSDNNLARIIYNGAYLHTNTDPEFASVLTHEFGHFFNLNHTFDRGCSHPNDEVEDTPPCTSAQGCHPNPSVLFPLNCFGDLVNSENYMDYNAECYKMFTKGQMQRMDTALYFPSRITLWQDSTLVSTGFHEPTSTGRDVHLQNEFNVYPNPVQHLLTVQRSSSIPYSATILDALGRQIASFPTQNGLLKINMEQYPSGLYYIKINDKSGSIVRKINRL